MIKNILTEADLAASLKGVTTDRFFTQEQLQHDADYYRAQRIAKTMLDSGLISMVQFNNLSRLNRKSFSPFLEEIMAKAVAIHKT